jgi:hypothetical protein
VGLGRRAGLHYLGRDGGRFIQPAMTEAGLPTPAARK